MYRRTYNCSPSKLELLSIIVSEEDYPPAQERLQKEVEIRSISEILDHAEGWSQKEGKQAEWLLPDLLLLLLYEVPASQTKLLAVKEFYDHEDRLPDCPIRVLPVWEEKVEVDIENTKIFSKGFAELELKPYVGDTHKGGMDGE